jgi:hypothetical protein
MCGTVEFVAPEIVNYDPVSTATGNNITEPSDFGRRLKKDDHTFFCLWYCLHPNLSVI